jgi:signal transduction histidine kinase
LIDRAHGAHDAALRVAWPETSVEARADDDESSRMRKQAIEAVRLARDALDGARADDAYVHSQYAVAIAMIEGQQALLRDALAHGLHALLLLDEADMALDWIDECAEVWSSGATCGDASDAACAIVEAQVRLACARSSADDPLARAALLAAAQRDCERAAHHALIDNRLASRAPVLETLVEVFVEADDIDGARAWASRLHGEGLHAEGHDEEGTPLLRAMCLLQRVRLDLLQGAAGEPAVRALDPLVDRFAPPAQALEQHGLLMQCLSQAHERSGNAEAALRYRKRWAESRDRVEAVRMQQQSRWAQRPLPGLRRQARAFVQEAMPQSLHEALRDLRAAAAHPMEPASRGTVSNATRCTQRAQDYCATYVGMLEADQADAQRLLPVDLGSLVANVCAEMDSDVQSGIVLVRRIEPDVRVMADHALLSRACANLLANALQHSPPRSTVTVAVHRSEDVALLSITDEGPGLPLSMRDRLFERYATERSDGGNGLGLALVARVVRQHQGWTEVFDGEGSGTTIRIALKALRTVPVRVLP